MADALNDNQISRTYDRIAEKSILSSVLQNSTYINTVVAAINENEFSADIYKKIFLAIKKLYNEGTEINVITVRDQLIKDGAEKNITDVSFLKDLTIFTPDPSQVESFIKIVREKYIIRKIIEECGKINKDCLSGEETASRILDEAQGKFFNLTKEKGLTEYVTLKEVIPEVFDSINEASKSKNGITGVETGIKKLDLTLAGLQKGNLIIIGARPSVGKTAFALNLAYGAMKNGVRPAFFSLEMSRREIAARLLQMESLISGDKFRNGQLTNNEWEDLYDAADNINGQLIIDDSAGITIAELRSKCRKLKKEKEGLDVVFIDYLQLMHAGNMDDDSSYKKFINNRQEEVAEISRSLKALAKELEIPIVALAQTRRPSDTSDKRDKRPQLEDLKESGSIEQDADVVLFLHRPTIEGEGGDPNEMQVIIAKHRNGKTGNIKLGFDGNKMKFYEIERSNIQQ